MKNFLQALGSQVLIIIILNWLIQLTSFEFTVIVTLAYLVARTIEHSWELYNKKEDKESDKGPKN